MPKKIKINRLHDLNKRRSVTSSNQIEGIKIRKAREEDILMNNVDPETKEEFLIYGYNKALENVFSVYKYQSLTESYIKDLHYLLYESLTPGFGGKYKVEQNYIREFDKNGRLIRTVFIPCKPEEVDSQMGNLVYQFNECTRDPNCNILITIFVFILDFLCIHPFYDGNGRVSRLLTTFLLMKYGYDLDQYYSLSYVILNNVETYYLALEKSSLGWHEDMNNYEYFVHFMLDCVKDGYKKLAYIIDVNSMMGFANEKVLKVINDSMFPITKSEIEEIVVSLSRSTIEKSLNELLSKQQIQMIQSGKYAQYYKI
ncbi:MAG: Fic family protein [Bacilli bacterium]|nr:Fic family protein [Bacilli bacterium]